MDGLKMEVTEIQGWKIDGGRKKNKTRKVAKWDIWLIPSPHSKWHVVFPEGLLSEDHRVTRETLYLQMWDTLVTQNNCYS